MGQEKARKDDVVCENVLLLLHIAYNLSLLCSHCHVAVAGYAPFAFTTHSLISCWLPGGNNLLQIVIATDHGDNLIRRLVEIEALPSISSYHVNLEIVCIVSLYTKFELSKIFQGWQKHHQ
ncbi:uncharacterized protein ZBIST_1802 [Zygosaccharomyces bailii]|nr:uncharacterized protein ZBIST_1802 [Zygosaccharomyces bailii]